MANRFTQAPAFRGGVTRFERAPQPAAERSRMSEVSRVITGFNAGDLVPIALYEVLPSQSLEISVQEVIRQNTIKFPTMGEMYLDLYAFFVPNRVVNDSWKEVQGENSSGSWTAPEITLAPLYTGSESVQIPVGSVADYYGLPTQSQLVPGILQRMNDLPFRGYLSIYNEYFRDQNYQPPIPFSKLNVYEGFLLAKGTSVPLVPAGDSLIPGSSITGSTPSDGGYENGGSVVKAIYGEGSSAPSVLLLSNPVSSWSALDKPLKANKLHDAFTSVLPSPQRGPDVTFTLASGALPVTGFVQFRSLTSRNGLTVNGTNLGPVSVGVVGGNGYTLEVGDSSENHLITTITGDYQTLDLQDGSVDLSSASSITVNDLRTAIAIQQLYELYGRAGGRYREICHALFGVTADDPYSDIPQLLGKHRVSLDLYQTAQTSATSEESPQGNLAAFGYTSKGGFLFHKTFLEHGFVHILAVVRQRNVYPSYLAPHWFRTQKLDFYNPVLANLGEQPIMSETINPFGTDAASTVFGYQEAWWDYRQHPDVVTGYMRNGISESLASWTYQDNYDSSLLTADADWIESNAQEVMDNTLVVQSSTAVQLRAIFAFSIINDFPGPVYSVPGLDQI